MRTLAKRLAISIASLALILVVAELVARALEPGPFTAWDQNPYRRHPDNERIARHAPDFTGRWDGTWYETNSLGLRGPELRPTFGENEYRVACIGDSCTFGKGVLESESWPRQLESLLRERSGGAWRPLVANLGVNGYSGLTYELAFRELGVPLRPHVVVVGYNLNDFPNAVKATDAAVYGDRPLRLAVPDKLRDALNRFALYRRMRATYYHWNRERDFQSAERIAASQAATDLDSDVWRVQQGFLQAIRDQAEACGARTMVFLFPYESQVYLDAYDPGPIERLREVCARLDLPFVDLARVFRDRARDTHAGEALFLKGDRYHPTALGYRIVAEQVMRVVAEEGWLPDEP